MEAYLGKGEYEKVLFSEGNKIFFVQGLQPDISSGVSTNDLWVVCILNLDDVKSGINHRADEEVHQDLMTELSNVVMLDNIKSIEYDMDNLKRVVEEAFDFDSFNYTDIHPYHVFMVKLEVNYALIKNNC